METKVEPQTLTPLITSTRTTTLPTTTAITTPPTTITTELTENQNLSTHYVRQAETSNHENREWKLGFSARNRTIRGNRNTTKLYPVQQQGKQIIANAIVQSASYSLN